VIPQTKTFNWRSSFRALFKIQGREYAYVRGNLFSYYYTVLQNQLTQLGEDPTENRPDVEMDEDIVDWV